MRFRALMRVQRLVQNGNVWCILDNHELNLLRDEAKDGSGWFFDERYQINGGIVRPNVRLAHHGSA